LFSLVDPLPIRRNHLHLIGALPKDKGEEGCKGFRCWVLQRVLCSTDVAQEDSPLVQAERKEPRSIETTSERAFSSDQHIRLGRSWWELSVHYIPLIFATISSYFK